ncbi:hypothetical protein [Mucilaginibacter sp. HD30]
MEDYQKSKTPAEQLQTEGPVFVKDEQGQNIERLKPFQAEAIKKWHQLKDKDKDEPFEQTVNDRVH